MPDGALEFSFANSSGPGGQNVNKRATKAVLRIAIEAIPIHPEARVRLATLGYAMPGTVVALGTATSAAVTVGGLTPDPVPGSDAEWKLLLKEYPQLIRRPVVVLNDGSMSQGFSDNGFKKLFGIDK